MQIVLPVFEHSIYSVILAASILIGIIVACIMMRRAGAKKDTVFYTALFVFVSIVVCSFTMSFCFTGNIKDIGFVGAGGALGVLVGAGLSIFIHEDHMSDSLSAWIITAPLMYGLSKLACHFSGCCYGFKYEGPFAVIYKGGDYVEAPLNTPLFPVQILESVIFILIFITGFILYGKMKSTINASLVTIVLCVFFKCLLDIFRNRGGLRISSNKIMAVTVGTVSIIFILLAKKLIMEYEDGSKQSKQ